MVDSKGYLTKGSRCAKNTQIPAGIRKQTRTREKTPQPIIRETCLFDYELVDINNVLTNFATKGIIGYFFLNLFRVILYLDLSNMNFFMVKLRLCLLWKVWKVIFSLYLKWFYIYFPLGNEFIKQGFKLNWKILL